MALGFVDGEGMRVRACVRVDIGWSSPHLEVGVTSLGSGTHRGADNVVFAVGNVLAGCERFLDSRATLGDGASVGSCLGTSLGACGSGEWDIQYSNIFRTSSMASSWAWLVMTGASLMAQVIILIAWVILFSCVRAGCVM